jgi:FtsH-binding integral membrane protein
MPSTRSNARSAARGPARTYRWIGLAILAVPATLIAVFAVAEGIGQEPGWWGHLLQLAVLALVASGAWMRPRIGGPLLILLGIAFAGSVALGSREAPNLAGLAIVAAPLIASGAFFTLAGRTAKRVPSQR